MEIEQSNSYLNYLQSLQNHHLAIVLQKDFLRGHQPLMTLMQSNNQLILELVMEINTSRIYAVIAKYVDTLQKPKQQQDPLDYSSVNNQISNQIVSAQDIDFRSHYLDRVQKADQNNQMDEKSYSHMITQSKLLDKFQKKVFLNSLKQCIESLDDKSQLIEAIYHIEDTPDSFISQYYVIQQLQKGRRLLQILSETKIKQFVLLELVEKQHKNLRHKYFVNICMRASILIYDQSSQKFKFQSQEIHKFINYKIHDSLLKIFPRYQTKLINYLFVVDEIQASKLLISLQAAQTIKEYYKIEAHKEEFLILLITRDQIQTNSELSKFILHSIFIVISQCQSHFLTLNVCLHLIQCLSQVDGVSFGDQLIFSLLHKVCIQSKQIINDILHHGFPLRYVQKLVNNVESLHITMQNAEEIINSNERRDFITSFFQEITKKYKNERSNQIAKFIEDLTQIKNTNPKQVNGQSSSKSKQAYQPEEIIRVF